MIKTCGEVVVQHFGFLTVRAGSGHIFAEVRYEDLLLFRLFAADQNFFRCLRLMALMNFN